MTPQVSSMDTAPPPPIISLRSSSYGSNPTIQHFRASAMLISCNVTIMMNPLSILPIKASLISSLNIGSTSMNTAGKSVIRDISNSVTMEVIIPAST